MRLYGMYYLCKEYIESIESMNVETKTVNNTPVKFIRGWKKKSQILNELAKIKPLTENAKKMYEAIPTVFCEQDEFDIGGATSEKFKQAKIKLLAEMNMIIKLYEILNTQKSEEISGGFDIKLPQFDDIGDFSECLKDLEFVIKQCPYLSRDDCRIKYGSVDVGSTWITFLLVGAGASAMLLNLSKLIDAAVKIKSHVITVKMQEEALRSIELKNEMASEFCDTFKKVNNAITDQHITELQQEIGELKDGEEKDKTRRSLEKLAFWMDRGMQIYSTIDAPKEIRDLFPEQVEATYLTDNIQKLLEMKKEE